MKSSVGTILSRSSLAIAAGLSLMLGACGDSDNIDPKADGGMVGDAADWPSWGRSAGEQHYSPLDEIDVDNVGDLKLAWHYNIEPGYSASTPIKAGDKMFITTGHSHIRALSASTGELLWEYDGGTRERANIPLHMSWGNKGIAYWDNKVFLATTDGFIVALDANDGNEVWKVRDFPENELRNINGAPRIFDGKVIIGHGGADLSAIRGYVSAYDAKTGDLSWRFYTVPGDPSQPAENKAEEIMRPTWKGDWYGVGGGGTAWNAFSYDPELNLIYLGVGNGFPYSQKLRSPGGGDNLFLASIVAVKADTGEYVWHYQVCPGEQWDCTATQDMTLATLEIDGKPRKVLMQAPKNGFFYVLDRQTGEFISAEKIAKVTWADRIDPATGRPVENPGIRYDDTGAMFELWPGPSGAHNWLPQAYSPRTNLVYIPVIEQGALIGPGQDGMSELGINMGATLLPEVELKGNRRSYLKAWDPVKQKAAWQIELPGSWPGGLLATGGDLVFQGRIDHRFVAYDANSGEELWSFKTDAPIVAPPISYSVDGTQYVSVITGNGGNGGGVMSIGQAAYRTDYNLPRRVLTFALNGEDNVPPFTPEPLTIPDDPDFAPDSAIVQQGAVLFGIKGCLACHGYNAVGGGAAPDLRYSPTIVNRDAFHQIVKEGALKSNGMPGFAELTTAQIEAIRDYLRARSKQAPAEMARLKASQKKQAAAASKAKAQEYEGVWNLIIDSPIGEQEATADLKVDGNKISGTVGNEDAKVDVSGTIKNGRAKFSGQATEPFKMKIEYDVTVNNGKLSGDNTNGAFGTFPVRGTKK